VRVAHIDQAPSSHRQSEPKNVPFRSLTATPNTIADFPEICIPGFSCRKSKSWKLVGIEVFGITDFSGQAPCNLTASLGLPGQPPGEALDASSRSRHHAVTTDLPKLAHEPVPVHTKRPA
jgi:hypothetical protein